MEYLEKYVLPLQKIRRDGVVVLSNTSTAHWFIRRREWWPSCAILFAMVGHFLRLLDSGTKYWVLSSDITQSLGFFCPSSKNNLAKYPTNRYGSEQRQVFAVAAIAAIAAIASIVAIAAIVAIVAIVMDGRMSMEWSMCRFGFWFFI